MIPAQTFIVPPMPAPFQPPEPANGAPLVDRVWGGETLYDGAPGRHIKLWVAEWALDVVSIRPDGGTVEWTCPAPGATQISIAFDNNMNPVVAYQASGQSMLDYFSTLSSDRDTLIIPGTTSCMVRVDDDRRTFNSSSDVIFAYTTGSECFWRTQRDRYEVSRKVGDTTKRIIRMGMSETRRFQIEVSEVQ